MKQSMELTNFYEYAHQIRTINLANIKMFSQKLKEKISETAIDKLFIFLEKLKLEYDQDELKFLWDKTSEFRSYFI